MAGGVGFGGFGALGGGFGFGYGNFQPHHHHHHPLNRPSPPEPFLTEASPKTPGGTAETEFQAMGFMIFTQKMVQL